MTKGLVVDRVQKGSLAEQAGLRTRDEIIAVDGQLIRDVIDYRFHTAEEVFEITYCRTAECHTILLERDYNQALGLSFLNPTVDGIRRCANDCTFCFVHQLPPGLRRTLYIRDDDYRYSFLFGNFVTLSNLREEDWARVESQHLSPLYVSVHATDPERRRAMLGNRKAPDILPLLQRLQRIGIDVHAQIVLCPGLNDGPTLEKTIIDLAGLWPSIRSISIVPVGLTRYQSAETQPVSATRAVELVSEYTGLAAEYRERLGVSLVYLADEIYLLADEPLPFSEEYDGYPQLSNGVGMVRFFLDRWESLSSHSPLRGDRAAREVTLVTGTLFAPVLRPICREMARRSETTIQVQPIVNHFFGPSVNVAGLLTAGDVVAALRHETLGDLVVLPRQMLDASGTRSLDDWSMEQMSRALKGVPLAVADGPEELLRLVAEEEP